jgi:Flp pilus assembly pilin Flp
MRPGVLERVLRLKCLATRDEGQSLVEYALVAALIAVFLVVSTHSFAILLTTALVNLASAFLSYLA